jgi:PKD domain
MRVETTSKAGGRARWWQSAVLAVGLAAVVMTVLAVDVQQAAAVILPAVTIDGPSEEIVGFGGVAMAEDGTGGVVYLKRVEGVPHVFVSRYSGGHWQAPIRVDGGEPFAASWPRIGAADGGQLVVVWATPFATEGERPVDELLGATLGSGATSFGPAMIVDPNIGDGTGTSPDLAMSLTGFADVAYRVVNENASGAIPLLRPGDVVEEVRVARYDGESWTRLGAINRDPGVSMRPPTAANAPRIAIGQTGNAVVVWQEPEIEGVARIWARRIFANTLDYVLPVTATSFDGQPIDDDADAPSVAITRQGQAEVAYRQDAGPGSPLPGPRIFVNTLPDGESASGAEFAGASIADSQVAGGESASVGSPSIDVDERNELRLLYDDNGAPRVVDGDDLGLTSSLTLGSPFVGAEDASVSVVDPEGGGVSAWPSADTAGQPEVAVREDFPGGAAQTALVGGGAGGEVAELAVGNSGLGDGLVAFRQGPLGNAAIVAAQATAFPLHFLLNVPRGWITPSQAVVSWLPAPSANGPVSYQVVLDGRPLVTPAGVFQLRLDPHKLGSGIHRLQVLATDRDGQATLSASSKLEVDGQPPIVAIEPADGGRAVSVHVSDAYSGVQARSVRVSFGDGFSAGRRTVLRHRYAHPGIYRIVVRVRDRVGNVGVVRRLVSVR